MKFVGHTMGTPCMSVKEAMDLYAAVGMDGIEVVTQTDQAFSIDASENLIKEVIDSSRMLRDGVVSLMTYFWDINNSNEIVRYDSINDAKKAVQIARRLGAKYIRAGGLSTEDNEDEALLRTVEGLKEIAPVAEENDITILVENHPGSVARTGEQTYELINRVGKDCVKALYDPANVLFDTNEPWERTIEIQKDVIGYVHCKDFLIDGENRRPCIVGRGEVPWTNIMNKLVSYNYDGYVSFEYEKRWFPDDLPDANIGVLESVTYIKNILK